MDRTKHIKGGSTPYCLSPGCKWWAGIIAFLFAKLVVLNC